MSLGNVAPGTSASATFTVTAPSSGLSPGLTGLLATATYSASPADTALSGGCGLLAWNTFGNTLTKTSTCLVRGERSAYLEGLFSQGHSPIFNGPIEGADRLFGRLCDARRVDAALRRGSEPGHPYFCRSGFS